MTQLEVTFLVLFIVFAALFLISILFIWGCYVEQIENESAINSASSSPKELPAKSSEEKPKDEKPKEKSKLDTDVHYRSQLELALISRDHLSQIENEDTKFHLLLRILLNKAPIRLYKYYGRGPNGIGADLFSAEYGKIEIEEWEYNVIFNEYERSRLSKVYGADISSDDVIYLPLMKTLKNYYGDKVWKMKSGNFNFDEKSK